MIKIVGKGDLSKTNSFLERCKEIINLGILNRYGREGVAALMSATPKDTGKTSESWRYEIIRRDNTVSIQFFNDNVQNGCPIAIILQYGHATRNGSWVEGRDYINPAIRPVFDRMRDELWKEATK